MDEKLKAEQAEVRSGILELLELMAGENDHLQELHEAYDNLPPDAWVNQVV